LLTPKSIGYLYISIFFKKKTGKTLSFPHYFWNISGAGRKNKKNVETLNHNKINSVRQGKPGAGLM
jgi:hypothetical protein